MDRRKFIQQIGALGLISLLPASLVATNHVTAEMCTFLPQQHIRHGLFSLPDASENVEWYLSFQRNRFYANGVEASDDDLQHFSFYCQQTPIQIGVKKAKFYISDSNGTYTYQREKTQCVNHSGFSFRFANDEVVSLIDAMILPIESNVAIDGKALTSDVGIYINSKMIPLKINGQVLIINRIKK